LFNRLAEIAHSLLKLAPYDTLTMESRGLRRYITEMLPITDWSTEAIRPALILILKRLDRMFNKIHKMPTLRCVHPQALCTRYVLTLICVSLCSGGALLALSVLSDLFTCDGWLLLLWFGVVFVFHCLHCGFEIKLKWAKCCKATSISNYAVSCLSNLCKYF